MRVKLTALGSSRRRKSSAPLGGSGSLQQGRQRAYTDPSHASTIASYCSSEFVSVCEVREQRPFVRQADKLQQEFDYDFGSYLEHLEANMAGWESPRDGTGRRSQKRVPADIRGTTPAMHTEAPTKVVKTLELGPKKKMSRLTNFVRCDSHGGVRSTTRSWLESVDIPAHWHGVNDVRPSDITNSSLRSAMAWPEARSEQRLPLINWREIGAAERSLLDRTPRSNPECTRRLPPRTAPHATRSQRLDSVEFSPSRSASPRSKSNSQSPRRTTLDEFVEAESPRSVHWEPRLPQASRESSITPRLRRRLMSKS